MLPWYQNRKLSSIKSWTMTQVVIGMLSCYVMTHPTTMNDYYNNYHYGLVKAWEVRSSNSSITDAALCPDGNLCCGNLCLSGVVDTGSPFDNSGTTGSNATCCMDANGTTTTGCGVNYKCSVTNQSMCTATIDPMENQIPLNIPRTKLCRFTPAMRHIYAIPMPQLDTTGEEEDESLKLFYDATTRHINDADNVLPTTKKIPVAAYLSTMGPIHEDMTTTKTSTTTAGVNVFDHIQRVIILIHGSRRNVEDYLCCVNAAIPSSSSSDEDPNSILIVAPWFPTIDDGMINITSTPSQQINNTMNQFDILRWIGYNNNNSDPFSINRIFHTWRYGAGAVNYMNISSYDVVDTIISQYLYNTTKFPNLRNIIVTGHSAGGQYVQRWSLLSNSIRDQSFDDDDDDDINNNNRNDNDNHRIISPMGVNNSHYYHNNNNNNNYNAATSSSRRTSSLPDVIVHTVVANPKNYAYLDQRRWMYSNNISSSLKGKLNELEFRIPTDIEIAHCKSYNDWEWGFDHRLFNCSFNDNNDELVAPYVQKAIDIAGGLSAITHRYLNIRRVIYLSGEDDILMNGDCNDRIQGPNRRIRSERYYSALQEYMPINTTTSMNHQRYAVPNVPHNHCLMYQSLRGQQALFGIIKDNNAYKNQTNNSNNKKREFSLRDTNHEYRNGNKRNKLR